MATQEGQIIIRHGDRAERHDRDDRERDIRRMRDSESERVRDMTGIREREGERHDRPEGTTRNKT